MPRTVVPGKFTGGSNGREPVVITIPSRLWTKWKLDEKENYKFVLHAMYLGVGPETIDDLIVLLPTDKVRLDYISTAQFMGITENDYLYKWV